MEQNLFLNEPKVNIEKEKSTTTKTKQKPKEKVIPIWNLKEDLSTICEPIYKMACIMAENETIEETDNYIRITNLLGCDTFVPYGKNFVDSKGETYDGQMPETYEHPVSYAASCSIPGKIGTKTHPKINGKCEIKANTLKPCGNQDNCFLNRHQCSYCYNAIAKYIKFLRTYYPDEEERQRAKYKKNPWDTYKKLDPYDMKIDSNMLTDLQVPTKMLELGKLIIDKGIILPTILTKEDVINGNHLFITICIPEAIREMNNEQNLTISNFKKYLNKNTDLVEFKKSMSIYRYNREIPSNPQGIYQFFHRAFTGKEPSSTYFIAIVCLCYTLLQQGRYKYYYEWMKAREAGKNEVADLYITKEELKKATTKSRLYGIMLQEDNRLTSNVVYKISKQLQTINKDMTPVIQYKKANDFFEDFALNKDTNAENADFQFKTINKVNKNILYVLTNVDELFYFTRRLNTSGSNRSRTFREALNFIKAYRENYYILFSCNKEEAKKLVKLDESFPYLFERTTIQTNDDTAITAYYKFTKGNNNKINRDTFIQYYEKKAAQAPFKNDTLVRYLDNYYKNYKTLPENLGNRSEKNFEETLNSLVGLDHIKDQMRKLRNYMIFAKTAETNDLHLPSINRHMVFKGSPGTGKTTMARLIAKMMYDAGITKKDKLVECNANDFIAEYVGQTGPKTEKQIEQALDGVLFIDEAYALANGSDFGKEATATLLKEMEDNKDRLTVILAGYSKETEDYINSNPGLRSRIGYTFDFPDYTTEDLVHIFEDKMKAVGFKVTKAAKEEAVKRITEKANEKNFGNGRYIDKLIQEIIIQHAQNLNKTNIKTIGKSDIPTEEELHTFKEKPVKSIGFKTQK